MRIIRSTRAAETLLPGVHTTKHVCDLLALLKANRCFGYEIDESGFEEVESQSDFENYIFDWFYDILKIESNKSLIRRNTEGFSFTLKDELVSEYLENEGLYDDERIFELNDRINDLKVMSSISRIDKKSNRLTFRFNLIQSEELIFKSVFQTIKFISDLKYFVRNREDILEEMRENILENEIGNDIEDEEQTDEREEAIAEIMEEEGRSHLQATIIYERRQRT